MATAVMSKQSLVVSLILTAAASSALADPAVVFRDNGCNVLDGSGAVVAGVDCDYQVVNPNNGKVWNAHGTAQLPELAVFPNEAVRGDITDGGYFAGCWQPGDGCKYVLTPSGEFHFKAHVELTPCSPPPPNPPPEQ